MRNFRSTIEGVYYQIDYPERVSFAYNYNPIIFSSNDDSAFDYTIAVASSYVETRSINVSSFKHNAKANISLLLQMLFGDDLSGDFTRDKKATVTISRGETQILSFELMVLYARISIGERIQSLGMFANPNAEHYTREITWFANFPFDLSYLVFDGDKVQTRVDGGAYGAAWTATSTTEGIRERAMLPTDASERFVLKITRGASSSTFDQTFDYTFFRLGSADSVITLRRNDAKCGYYFRWIDNRGFWMQYLFDEGFVETKNELGDTTREYFTEHNGINYATKRALSVDISQTIKCCATSLNPQQYEDVATIVGATYVELFAGMTENQEPIWIPCNVSSGSYQKNDKHELNDFEISVEFKEQNQRL